jgi:hypothetical protein
MVNVMYSCADSSTLSPPYGVNIDGQKRMVLVENPLKNHTSGQLRTVKIAFVKRGSRVQIPEAALKKKPTNLAVCRLLY